MAGLLIVALLALVLFGLGFAVHFIWIGAAIAALSCLVAVAIRPRAARAAQAERAAQHQ
jgi:hypothetical protein